MAHRLVIPARSTMAELWELLVGTERVLDQWAAIIRERPALLETGRARQDELLEIWLDVRDRIECMRRETEVATP